MPRAKAYAAAWKTAEADLTESQLTTHSITIQVAMHAMLTCIIASFLKRKPQHPFCAMPQASCRDFLDLCNNSSGMFWVCSLEYLLSTTIPESQDSVSGPFSKIIGCAKAVLGVHALQLCSRSDQNR